MKLVDPITVTSAILQTTNVPENEYPVYDPNGVYGPGDSVIVPGEHTVYQQLRGFTSVVTLTIGNPCDIAWPGHTLTAGAPVKLTTTGTLPTGLASGTTYYVVSPTATGFRVAATPGGAPIAVTGAQSGTHTATSNAIGMAPATSPLYWKSMGASNAWKMFDVFNNTATAYANSIVVSLRPGQICSGIYLGGLDAASVTVEVVDAVEGIVYSKTESLIQSNSGSSFWNWHFQRIIRRRAFFAIDLPPYFNATINVRIDNAGGIAKCAMFCVGTVVDLGLTFYGVATDMKDWSTTEFKKDGTSSTVERGFSRRMTLDVKLTNDRIDSVQDTLASYRQKVVVWIGIKASRWTVICGRYSSFKNVIESFNDSRMALTIEGIVE